MDERMTQFTTDRHDTHQPTRPANVSSSRQQPVRVDGTETPSLGERDSQGAWSDLVTRICRASTYKEACRTLAIDSQQRFGCTRVAVGMRTPNGTGCKLQALSDVEQFSRRSEATRLLENAMEEALAVWVNDDDFDSQRFTFEQRSHDESSFTHAQRRLSVAGGHAVLQTVPLSDNGRLIGCLLVASPNSRVDDKVVQDFRCSAMPGVVSSLDVIRRASMTLWTRIVTSVATAVRGRRFAVSIIATIIVAGVLAIPRQYQVSCDCLVEPSVRRYVPLPFDAVLSESLVTPGDVVEVGQQLATLDGREVRCDLAAIEADSERIGKQRDMALAQGKTTEVQIARLELARLEQQRLVLERHASQLEIRSPIRGVIISGDLDKVQGASLDKGRTLFEVGPLDKMTVEVMIPESEIALTEVGAAVTLRLDSVPGRVWNGSVEKIHPRAEIHEDDNVFVADVRLENSLGELRPGMKGKASITGPRRSIGWTLFHKPWRSLQRWLRV